MRSTMPDRNNRSSFKLDMFPREHIQLSLLRVSTSGPEDDSNFQTHSSGLMFVYSSADSTGAPHVEQNIPSSSDSLMYFIPIPTANEPMPIPISAEASGCSLNVSCSDPCSACMAKFFIILLLAIFLIILLLAIPLSIGSVIFLSSMSFSWAELQPIVDISHQIKYMCYRENPDFDLSNF